MKEASKGLEIVFGPRAVWNDRSPIRDAILRTPENSRAICGV